MFYFKRIFYFRHSKGLLVGLSVGYSVGFNVGTSEGRFVGLNVGVFVGLRVDGAGVGLSEGSFVGPGVGAQVNKYMLTSVVVTSSSSATPYSIASACNTVVNVPLRTAPLI